MRLFHFSVVTFSYEVDNNEELLKEPQNVCTKALITSKKSNFTSTKSSVL